MRMIMLGFVLIRAEYLEARGHQRFHGPYNWKLKPQFKSGQTEQGVTFSRRECVKLGVADLCHSCISGSSYTLLQGLERLHQYADKEINTYLNEDGSQDEFNNFRTKLACLTR
ncbi:hypothetical protein L1987_18324 [Smallanthus sonchifolius]|uniref:Uncharacterized protein n=1 Tax=Smallanthus sonchifolius TaxID=185202 RepID=A0ACB9J1H1_9ASTR|nr:hypothetical protein L1987_18324 [Smallanthus sonchifolius]